MLHSRPKLETWIERRFAKYPQKAKAHLGVSRHDKSTRAMKMPSPQPRSIHIVFAGGVTHGHLNPGLAVAAQLRAQCPDARITFLGPGALRERTSVAQAGFDYVPIRCPPAPRRIWHAPAFAARLWSGRRAAATFLAQHPADVVVGLGGYASVPTALAAIGRRAPLLLLEQNVVWGRANRWLASWSTGICCPPGSGANAAKFMRDGCQSLATGTPVRLGFLDHRARVDRSNANDSAVRAARQDLLIMGGTSGARALNRAVPLALAMLRPSLAGWRIVHQTGPLDVAATLDAYGAAGIEADVTPHIAGMSAQLAQTGLAICRAGGSTLAELAVMRVPAVLVPLPTATDDHQRHNALAWQAAGAARTIDSRHMNESALAEQLANTLSGLLTDGTIRQAMREAMGRIARPRAAAEVAEIVLKIARQDVRLLFAGETPGEVKPPDCPDFLPWIDTRAA